MITAISQFIQAHLFACGISLFALSFVGAIALILNLCQSVALADKRREKAFREYVKRTYGEEGVNRCC